MQTCFKQTVRVPGKRGQPLSRAQSQALIVALWQSNRNKDRCGRRLLAFYTNKEA